MPVSNTNTYTVSTANGVTTVFPYDFTLLDVGDLVLTVDDVVITTGFTVSGVGDAAGGNITFSVAPANGAIVLRERVVALTRSTDYQYVGSLSSEVLDSDFDRLWLALQRANREASRALKLPLGHAGSAEVPALVANAYPRANSAGSAIEWVAGPDISGTTQADLVAFTDSLAPAYLKTVSDIINGDEVSILRFIDRAEHPAILGMTSSVDLSTEWQEAFSAGGSNGIHLLVPRGKYNIPSQVATTGENVNVRGAGRPLLVVGAGQIAGYQMFPISHSGFSASGLRIESANRTHCFYIQPPTAADLSGFHFERIEGSGLFYLVRGDGAADRYIRDATVIACKNTAPIGANSGHFMFDHSDGVKYIGNTIINGYNSSGFGLADSRNFAVVGNVERSLQDSAAATEAACQIEDSDGANGVISGNSFQHDIWVAGSNGVNISGNTCRRMRLTVGNADGYNVHSVKYAANRAAQIHIDKFSAGTPAERISAQFDGNEISPDGRTVFGSAISSAAYINGNFVTSLGMSGNKVISDATTYALDINRAAGATFRFNDNDFGTKAHSLSGTTGLVYERNNSNALYKTGSGYIDVYMASTFSISAGAWQATVLSGVNANINNEWSSSTFTPVESGCYRFTGIMTVDPDAAGNQLGFQIERTSGTPTVLARLAFARSTDANSVGIPLRSVDLNLTAGDVVQLQHFLTGATTQFSTGTTVTNLQITRIR